MERRCLVVIPLSKVLYRYGFSAPLGYLFGGRSHLVHGVFSKDLTSDLVAGYQYFIVELNWVTELFEFHLIVDFIRKYNANAKILFGGLFSQLHYETIFRSCAVDLFIRGDNELPLRLFLEGEALRKIPNLVSRDGASESSYTLLPEEFKGIEFDIEWFPSYKALFSPLSGCTDLPETYDTAVSEITNNQLTRDEMFYSFPLIVTTKKCSVIHAGCDYCMGSKSLPFQNTAAYSNDALISVLRGLEKKGGDVYGKVCLYILNDIALYDFSNVSFDMNVFIEYDGALGRQALGPRADRGRLYNLEKLFHAFRGGICRLPASTAGLHDRSRDIDYAGIIKRLETARHRIKFMLYEDDSPAIASMGLDSRHVECTLDNFDYRGKLRFDTYASFAQSLVTSIELYNSTKINEQFNLNRVLEYTD